jgi:hypothetical protein
MSRVCVEMERRLSSSRMSLEDTLQRLLDTRSNERILDRYRDERGRPEIVYHYTSLQSFLEIVRGGTIWCSNVDFANDPTEIRYGSDLIERVMRDEYPEAAAMGLLRTLPDIDYYVASFCVEGDVLPLWRAYCRNGRGVSIGLRAAPLAVLKDMIFAPIAYHRAQQEGLIRDILNAFMPRFAEAKNDIPALQEHTVNVAAALGALRAILKAPSYASEMEYRLFTAGFPSRFDMMPNLGFRATPSALIPYLSVRALDELGKLPIARVVIGPCLDFVRVGRSVREVFRQSGYENVSVERSTVQMRDDN